MGSDDPTDSTLYVSSGSNVHYSASSGGKRPSGEGPQSWLSKGLSKGAAKSRSLTFPESPRARRCFRVFWKYVKRISQFFAYNSQFSSLTTLLTIYALFGDDIRLLFTSKQDDYIFDYLTMSAMVTFSFECVVCSIGKAGYLGGFFFWLDLLSTVTLILDVTFIAEELFGDSVSSAQAVDSEEGGQDGGGDSAEAARAARMSRAGTKAGRIVRLIRLIRLIKLIKFYKKKETNNGAKAGYDWGDDEEKDMDLANESAVSKKLSEMTTRRVILLVLGIMLALPFTQSSMWGDEFSTSAQHGANIIYRRWCKDMDTFTPMASEANRLLYMKSAERRLYEDDFRQYLYYHNWFCNPSDPGTDNGSPLSSFGTLFFFGVSPPAAAGTEFFLPSIRSDSDYDWNNRWRGSSWEYYMCGMPDKVQNSLNWDSTIFCLAGTVRGISVAKDAANDKVGCPNEIRYQERVVIMPETISSGACGGVGFIFVFDRREGSMMDAALNFAQTLFICFLLGFGAVAFSNDANKLVLRPIETMISKLEKIRNDPLMAMTLGTAEQRKEEQAAQKVAQEAAIAEEQVEDKKTRCVCCRRCVKRLRRCCSRDSEQPVQEPMETKVLENTIIKIGSLLALGFGLAGGDIIGRRMKGSENQNMGAMYPGQKMEGIFSHCEIRNFMDVTDLLAETVMIFVNAIAKIVHSCCDQYHGYPGQNLGEAFLLVWRLSDHPHEKRQRLADMSVISIMKIVASIAKDATLADYKMHVKLQKRLPNYRIRMSSGVHYGTAIEGPVGTEFKIDALYLSHVTTAVSRLSVSTLEYGCLALVTESVQGLLSPPMKKMCRLIDRVVIPVGEQAPLRLYTIDLDDLALEITAKIDGLSAKEDRRRSLKVRYDKQKAKQDMWDDDFKIDNYLLRDSDIVTMRHKFTSEFECRFRMAYLNYEAGEWRIAKDLLESTKFLLGREDGPSASLLKFMRSFKDKPVGWRGYRELPSL